ncbi:immunity-related GTPase family M protein 1-like [Choloepus didactylus]|uniref:immunity-related GTPase family M protein 1-like n=1 Tax=Choloepus didactylus TaxID=27675 RepID=UPI0018A0AC9E|nr:immunity-related GTPase family M protein 1-like [Choloepus didactylus]
MDRIMKPSQGPCEATPLLIDTEESPVSPHTPLSASFPSVMPHHLGAEAWSVEKAWADGRMPQMVSLVTETVRTASCTPVNVAVTGDSGNGMSSFINALRGIGHEEEAAAPTGVVRTTLTRASYSSSHFPNVLLWDLPGTGSTTQSLENYQQEMQFSLYDLFIIITSEQFSMNHVRLAKAIERMGKKFYVVWTKLDRDLSTSAFREGELQQNIRGNILENLQKERVCEPPIFLVSSLDPSLHDFPKLRDTLQKDLTYLRCRGPLQNLFRTCEKIIDDKVTSLQEKIGTKSFQNTLGIRNADNLEECLKAYHWHFGVDDESLQLVAQTTGTDFPEYKAIMKSQDIQTVNKANWKLTLMNFFVFRAFLCLLSCIPFFGTFVIRSFRQLKQKQLLVIVAEDTKSILSKVLKDSIPHESHLGKSPPGSFASILFSVGFIFLLWK